MERFAQVATYMIQAGIVKPKVYKKHLSSSWDPKGGWLMLLAFAKNLQLQHSFLFPYVNIKCHPLSLSQQTSALASQASKANYNNMPPNHPEIKNQCFIDFWSDWPNK